MAEITCPDFRDMSLPELRAEYARFTALASRTAIPSAREPVQDVAAVIATWIGRREREAQELAA